MRFWRQNLNSLLNYSFVRDVQLGKKKLEIDKKITIGATVVNLFLLVLLVLATRQLAFPPQKSNIKIYNLGNNYYDLGIDQILAVYNSGNAPCFNLEIYDDVYLSSVFIIKDKNVDSFLFETPFASTGIESLFFSHLT